MDGDQRRPQIYISTQRTASIVIRAMRDDGARRDEAEEYIDSLIASSRRRFPEMDNEQQWAETKAELMKAVSARLDEVN